jgi:RNA polymerase sigma-70 factor (ECF subfamily)
MEAVMEEQGAPGISRLGISRDLVEKARAGDGEAFSLIAERSRPRLEALAYLRLGPYLRRRVEVDDVLQETYLRAYQLLNRFKYQGEAALLRWLEVICKHVIQDLGRYFSRKRRRAKVFNWAPLAESSGRLADGILDLLPAPVTSPSRALRREERFDRLEKALDSLSDEHREVLILARVQLLRPGEIAARMGRSEDAVAMLLLRAARKLRAILVDTESWHLPAERLEELLRPPRKDAASGNGAGGNNDGGEPPPPPGTQLHTG